MTRLGLIVYKLKRRKLRLKEDIKSNINIIICLWEFLKKKIENFAFKIRSRLGTQQLEYIVHAIYCNKGLYRLDGNPLTG